MAATCTRSTYLVEGRGAGEPPGWSGHSTWWLSVVRSCLAVSLHFAGHQGEEIITLLDLPDELKMRRGDGLPQLLLLLLPLGRRFEDVQVAVGLQRAIGLPQVVLPVGPHERQGEHRGIETPVLKRGMRQVAGNHVLVIGHMIKLGHRVLGKRLPQQTLTTAEVSDAPVRARAQPESQSIKRLLCPLLPGFPV